jgi:hypothetical protein
LHGFDGVVFARRHLLQRSCVDDEVDANHRASEAVSIADVSNEVSNAGAIEAAQAHLVLLQFIPAEYDQPLGGIIT